LILCIVYTSEDLKCALWARPNSNQHLNLTLAEIKCPVLFLQEFKDDGPHSVQSQVQFIELYSQVMADDGILIVEDVDELDYIEALKKAVPEHLKPFIKIYDLRSNKNRYDDIVFTIDRTNV
jgi:hypothetical protein